MSSDEIPLPPTAQVIAEVIGRGKTLLLARHIPHRHFYVPKTFPVGHWLPAFLGRDAANKLQKVFGGELVDLAKCTALARIERDADIVQAASNGEPLHSIATRHRLTPRMVRYVLDRQRFNDNKHSGASFPKNAQHKSPPPIGSPEGGRERVDGNSRNLARD